MISVHFQGKLFSITVIQVYAPTTNAEEAEVEQFYEDLQDLLELTPKQDVFFIIGDWNAKVGSQETPAVTGIFDLGVQNEAGQRLTEFCQENAVVIANTLFQQHKRRLHTSEVMLKILQARLQQYVTFGVAWVNEGEWKWIEALLEKGEVSWESGEAGEGDNEGRWCRDKSTVSIFGQGWSK